MCIFGGWRMKNQEPYEIVWPGCHSTWGSSLLSFKGQSISDYNLAKLVFRHEEGAVGRKKPKLHDMSLVIRGTLV